MMGEPRCLGEYLLSVLSPGTSVGAEKAKCLQGSVIMNYIIYLLYNIIIYIQMD